MSHHCTGCAFRLRDELKDAFVANTGPMAYQREAGNAVVPAALPGP